MAKGLVGFLRQPFDVTLCVEPLRCAAAIDAPDRDRGLDIALNSRPRRSDFQLLASVFNL
jgi:hypothetical protein